MPIDQIDPARIWEIATQDLPPLAVAAKAALQRLDHMPERYALGGATVACKGYLRGPELYRSARSGFPGRLYLPGFMPLAHPAVIVDRDAAMGLSDRYQA